MPGSAEQAEGHPEGVGRSSHSPLTSFAERWLEPGRRLATRLPFAVSFRLEVGGA